MNARQKILLTVFLSLTVVILILDNLCPGDKKISYVKFTTVFFLFMSAFFCRKRYREQVMLYIAVFFSMIGDFFLSICNVNILSMAGKAGVFGGMSFFLAYLALIAAFMKGHGAGKGGVLASAPVLALAVPVFLMIQPYIRQELYWGVVIFTFVLGFMAWAAICTMFRGYYSTGAARRLALAGYLIMASDSGVALAQFNPAFAGHFTPWLENIIWGTYVPAWTLVVVTIAGEDLLA